MVTNLQLVEPRCHGFLNDGVYSWIVDRGRSRLVLLIIFQVRVRVHREVRRPEEGVLDQVRGCQGRAALRGRPELEPRSHRFVAKAGP